MNQAYFVKDENKNEIYRHTKLSPFNRATYGDYKEKNTKNQRDYVERLAPKLAFI